MKNILRVIAIFCVSVFTACLDTEESIVINANNTGTYTITADMSKLLVMMNKMGTNADEKNKSGFSDSTIYFKDIIDQSELTASEKDLYRAGSFAMKVNENKGQAKIIISCPFKNLDELKELKLNLFNVVNKLDPKKDEYDTKDKEIVKTIFPFADQYSFDIKSGSITNTITDLNALKNKLAEDSTIQSMQELQTAFGEPANKVIFKLPKPIKKYTGPNAALSKDKKTISFLFTQKEMINNPAEAAYSIEY